MSSPVNYFIFHGAEGYPEENWFPWLKQQLSASGRVSVPAMPTPEGQSLGAWMAIAAKALEGCAPENTVLIGHSAGAVLVLRLAEKTRQPYKAVFSVCPFARLLNMPRFDPLIASFVEPVFDWQAIRRGAHAITCYAGDNDPYVPLDYAEDVARNTGAELIVVKNGGHLNAAAGYLEFPLLLEKITSL